MRGSLALLAVAFCACVSGLPLDEPRLLASEPRDDGVPGTKISYEVSQDGGYYFIAESSGNWSQAFEYCQAEGGHMAVIDSDAEADTIKQLIAQFRLVNIHLGFHDQYLEGVYTGVNDEAIDRAATFWANGAPTGGDTLNCGGFSSSGMQDIRCSLNRRTICELRKWTSYDVIPGHGMYNYHPERRTWIHAWETCRGEGGHLVVIDSVEELHAIKALYPGWEDMWVGVHRRHGNTLFTTLHGKPLESTGYMKWLPSYPYGDMVSRPYVVVKHSESAIGLWTFTPTGQMPFVCEHALV